MAFELPKNPWERGKEILIWAVLWAGFVNLVLVATLLWRLI